MTSGQRSASALVAEMLEALGLSATNSEVEEVARRWVALIEAGSRLQGSLRTDGSAELAVLDPWRAMS